MREAEVCWKRGVVLVCTNQRPEGAPKPSCGRVRGKALRTWLKQAARAEGGAAAEARVVGSSCLGLCPPDGVAVAMMPGNEMLVVEPTRDKPELLERLRAHYEARSPRSGMVGRLRNKLRR